VPSLFKYRSSEYSDESTLLIAGFGRFQLGIVTYTGLTWLADAAEMILLSFVGPAVSFNQIVVYLLKQFSYYVMIRSTLGASPKIQCHSMLVFYSFYSDLRGATEV
jgi:hypothetical protein